ncbi:MAG: four helix bundle protein [Acidobacteriia bacterium]|nr:four helix bundle protein [Terriglobia bacterium]
MRDFRKLKVWEKSHELALEIYRATRSFPKEELYGLISQMRRSVASIPTNIAEGCGRDGTAELGRFMRIALGSASELEYQLLLSFDLGMLKEEIFKKLSSMVCEIKKMLTGYLKTMILPA